MLVEFSVGNFRSVRSRQTLSLVAGSSQSARGRYSLQTELRAIPRLMRAVGIFGPNGAGKTSIISGLRTFSEIVADSARESQAGEELEIVPFLLAETRDEPSEFEIVCIVSGTLYQYGFTADKHRVHSGMVIRNTTRGSPPKMD